MNDNCKLISNTLSLRKPQHESLEILSQIIENIELSKTPDLPAVLQEIKNIATRNDAMREIKNFERDFPSICFSLATGVGKTRLMGAFISYLYLEKGVQNFFVLAPNLTIYNKLKGDFTLGNPKYVFKGIQEFAMNPPKIITGDDYFTMGGLDPIYNKDRVKINVFNISKINSEKNDRGTPKFRAPSETIGSSYFEYLQDLDDLVILMDEAHRYRASAGMKVINELNATLGLELTATAKSAGAVGKNFKNIVYHYALANAIHDGYVKKPAIITRSNFEKNRYTEEKIEEMKIKDGFYTHRKVKVELEVYANSKGLHTVKPFMLIIAKDTAHADELKEQIDSSDFEDGQYKGKVIVVHSNQKGMEKDANVELLLEVEKYDNPVEVVIHVNMLSEGWDVNNLYTIVPLKKADSKVLVEQSIGRGLRLPYGTHTGVDAIDRLNIIAHDKFDEIVRAAEKEEFEFQKQYIDLEEKDEGEKIVVDNSSSFFKRIQQATIDASVDSQPTETPKQNPSQKDLSFTFNNEREKQVSLATEEVITELDKVVSSTDELLSPEFQERVLEEVNAKTDGEGAFKFDEEQVDKKAIIKKTIIKYVEANIAIPQIIITDEMSGGAEYQHFQLDLTPFNNLKPTHQQILLMELLDRKIEDKGQAEFQKAYDVLEHYIMIPLMDDLSVPRDPELLLFFAKQVVDHIKGYATSEDELKKIMHYNDLFIADKVLGQMKQNIKYPEIKKVVRVKGNYTVLRPTKLLGNTVDGEMSFRNSPKDLTRIRKLIFTGFEKCLYDKKKFDSNTERQLAKVLEDSAEVIKWDKLSDEQAREKIPLTYTKEDLSSAQYCTDFIVETATNKYMIETKAQKDMNARDVLAKQDVAVKWCEEATKYETSKAGKPWHYVLIPHNALINETRTFDRLIQDWAVK